MVRSGVRLVDAVHVRGRDAVVVLDRLEVGCARVREVVAGHAAPRDARVERRVDLAARFRGGPVVEREVARVI